MEMVLEGRASMGHLSKVFLTLFSKYNNTKSFATDENFEIKHTGPGE